MRAGSKAWSFVTKELFNYSHIIKHLNEFLSNKKGKTIFGKVPNWQKNDRSRERNEQGLKPALRTALGVLGNNSPADKKHLKKQKC